MRYILLALTFASSFGWACSVPPESLYQSNNDLVRSTPVVVLASPFSFFRDPDFHVPVFSFRTTKVLKGDAPEEFRLPGYLAETIEEQPEDFEGHSSPGFWAYKTGASIQPGNCVAYGIFSIGDQYLIFLRKESHTRAYEMVKSEEDLWYRVVELIIENQNEYSRNLDR